MLKKFILIILLINSNLFGQDFQWVRKISGVPGFNQKELVTGFVVDSDENTYSCGRTESYKFDLDPTETGQDIVDNIIPGINAKETFLVKTDSNGNYIWGLMFVLNTGVYGSNDQAFDVKIGTDGNIYILLSLNEFNTQTNTINSFIKLIKISPNGIIISTISIKQNYINNGGGTIFPYSFDLDAQNNIFLSGWFVGNMLIDTNPNFTLNNNNGIGNFLFKINNNGFFEWVKQFNIGDNSENKLIVRPDGNINFIIKNNNNYSLLNINNSNGLILWQKDFVNQSQIDFIVNENGIVILGDKEYYEEIDVDPSSDVVNISGFNTFVLFLNYDGTYLDHKLFIKSSSSGSCLFSSLTFDENGDYYFGGNFSDIVDFDPSSNINNMTAGYFGDAFFLKLDSNRNFDSVLKFGQELPLLNNFNICDYLKIKKIKVKNNNNYLLGEFNRVCDFDPSPITQTSLDSMIIDIVYNYDGFILKLGPCNSTIPVASSNQIFCSSQNPTIANLAPNSSSVKWFDSLTSTIQLNNTTPLINGQIYYVARQNGNCPESQRLAVTTTINQSPNPPIATNQIFCESENAKISDLIANGQNVKWYLESNQIINLPSSTILQDNTIYYATQTVNGCESEKKLINVTINNVSLPIATPNQTFCIQDNATINSIAITGQSIKWYDAATLGNLVPASTLLVDATTYYASQTLNGCESLRIPVAITIQNTAAPTTANASQPFCATQNATLSSIAITGASIKWYATTTSTAALPSNTVLTNATTYYATQTIDNCESNGRLPIAISLTTTLNAVDYSKSYCDDLDDGFENILLSDFNVNLLPTYTNETFSFYTVANSAENELLDDKISINYILETGNHIIYVRIDSVNGCHQVVKLNLTLFTAPIINLKDIVPICENKNITVNAGSGYDSYTWSNGIINQSSINITQPGSFSVTVTKNNGSIICSTTKNFEVVKSNIASILSIETSDWTNDQNSISIMLSATSVGDYEYSLGGIKYQDSPVFNNLYSGFYTVYINDKNNCGEIKDDAFLLMYPTFFTPNGDGFNDYWKIKFSEIESGLSVKIFGRYGKLIKILNNSEQGWDGTFNQKQLPADDYWFVISRRNGKTYKNHFSLKR